MKLKQLCLALASLSTATPNLRSVLILGAVTVLVSSPNLWGDVTQFREVLPHVVEGCSGICLETTVTIVNPGPDAVEVTLLSEAFEVGPPFVLAALETQEILFQGEGQLTLGAVQVVADHPLSVSATLRSKADAEATDSLSVATVIGSRLTSKTLVPVFLRSPIAENTGVALFYNFLDARLELRFTLFDRSGQQVATVRARAPVDPNVEFPSAERASFFVTELFPELPDTFTTGSLVIEQEVPSHIADAFAVTALYTQGTAFRAAEVTAIDDVRAYSVKLPSAEGVAEVAADLAEVYGFTVSLVVTDFFQMRTTKEVARAVARDGRVTIVRGSIPIAPPP